MEKTRWREENEAWLDLSFEIGVKALGALRENKASDTYPKTQRELAEVMGCSARFISKILKGNENLRIATISKLGTILNIPLIEISENSISDQERVGVQQPPWTRI